MLSPEQIQDLRRSVMAAQEQPCPGPYRLALCIDGPLEGIRVKLTPSIYFRKEASFGWCTVIKTGPCVSMYEQSGKHGQWRFRGYDYPGARASGMRATS